MISFLEWVPLNEDGTYWHYGRPDQPMWDDDNLVVVTNGGSYRAVIEHPFEVGIETGFLDLRDAAVYVEEDFRERFFPL